MGVPGNASPLLLTSAAGAAAGYQISRSVRFNSSDSAYLSGSNFCISRAIGTTFTYALWVKRSGAIGCAAAICIAALPNYARIADNFIFRFQSDSGKITFADSDGTQDPRSTTSLQTASVIPGLFRVVCT
jgi:hypothetical protein